MMTNRPAGASRRVFSLGGSQLARSGQALATMWAVVATDRQMRSAVAMAMGFPPL
ncbi:MAG: hypothetical protein HEQ16_16380 [Bosea sp.]|nr:hypothetical protein [Bosea sp. (in: a-proteobacteria)]